MGREVKMEESMREIVESTPVGELVPIDFGKLDVSVDVTFEFSGGWSVKRTILPGQSLGLKKGAGEPPKITINISPSDDELSLRKQGKG